MLTFLERVVISDDDEEEEEEEEEEKKKKKNKKKKKKDLVKVFNLHKIKLHLLCYSVQHTY